MDETTNREEEIADLRERQGLTYKAIGERYHISPSRAAQIYRRLQRRRQEQRRRELYQKENQKTVSFSLTLGEVVVLNKILLDFRVKKVCGGRRGPMEDVDYLVAARLSSRLSKLEHDTRGA